VGESKIGVSRTVILGAFYLIDDVAEAFAKSKAIYETEKLKLDNDRTNHAVIIPNIS
jgi:hypothetical protein